MSEKEKIPQLPDGCGYFGHEFGASYPDSQCYGGQLYDLDDCDNSGNLFEPLEYIACPECNHDEWLEAQREDIENLGWEAKEKGLPEESNPFPARATRYPKDGEWYKERWLEGYRAHPEFPSINRAIESTPNPQ
jgi:hypothetical protein